MDMGVWLTNKFETKICPTNLKKHKNAIITSATKPLSRVLMSFSIVFIYRSIRQISKWSFGFQPRLSREDWKENRLDTPRFSHKNPEISLILPFLCMYTAYGAYHVWFLELSLPATTMRSHQSPQQKPTETTQDNTNHGIKNPIIMSGAKKASTNINWNQINNANEITDAVTRKDADANEFALREAIYHLCAWHDFCNLILRYSK